MMTSAFKISEIPWSLCGERFFNYQALGAPLLRLGGERSAFSLLALAWDELLAEEVLQQPLPAAQIDSHIPWTLGTLGLVSYDAYNPFAGPDAAPQRYFRIRRSLVVDQKRRQIFLCEEPDADACRWHTPAPWQIEEPSLDPGPEPVWINTWEDARYQATVASLVEEIRQGRFYQLNLLRYWIAQNPISRARWLLQLQRWAGPYAAYLDFDDCSLVSFSPERFFSLRPEGDSWRISTWPIKGTRPVSADARRDAELQEELAQHPKDRAELSMIVDLMRNDLNRVCLRSSVRVRDAGSIQSFSNVHHLVAHIDGMLSPGLTLGTLLQALCPGGSITGAPKREVMAGIREREERDRQYFMGHLIYLDAYTGRCDSSILIRTAQRRAGAAWEFAAGSGLVIHSDPAEEMAEVAAKARVVLEVLGKA